VSRSLRRPSQIRQLSEERNTAVRSANAVARILRHGEFILILLVRRLVHSVGGSGQTNHQTWIA
jgi:hypothetical protein